MVKKLKTFLRKHIVFVVIGIIIVLLSVLILILLLRDKDTYPIDPGTGLPIPPSELEIVKQHLGYHKNYRISFSPSAVEELSELEKSLYPSFKLKEGSHLEWVEKFVKDTGLENLEYSESSPSPELTIHYWEYDNGTISYNYHRDTLFFTFSQGLSLAKPSFNPSDIANVKKNLHAFSKRYLSSDFEYEIEDIVREGNDYRINFSRLLGDYRVYIEAQDEYLILTPDGRLKEGFFLLSEFMQQKNMSYPLIRTSDLVSKISSLEYPKNVNFFNLDPSIESKYEPYGYAVYSNPFTQEGSVNVNSYELVYYHTNRNHEVSVLTFVFSGNGSLDVEGTSSVADFEIISSAISPDYVFIPPPSFFEQLKNVK